MSDSIDSAGGLALQYTQLAEKPPPRWECVLMQDLQILADLLPPLGVVLGNLELSSVDIMGLI